MPGRPAQQIEEAVSFRNLFPTLFDYLEIESFDETLMLGSSVLPPRKGGSEILMFSPDGRRADLRLEDGMRVQFNVLMRADHAAFTPVGVVDAAGDAIADPLLALDGVPWRRMIEERMSWHGARSFLEEPALTASQGTGEVREGRPLLGPR